MPKDLRELMRRMAAENPIWGEERIANGLKLGIRVSPRTVEKYLRIAGPVRTPDPKQRWLTFVHNHAKVIVACDFFVLVTAAFRTLYVFVIMKLDRRRILHHNVTAHPTAESTLRQFRETLPDDHPYRFVIHERDSIFSKDLDKAVADMGVRVLRMPVRAPMANSVHGRLHMSLGPGIPTPLQQPPPENGSHHSIPAGHVIRSKSVLGGLHLKYSLEKVVAWG